MYERCGEEVGMVDGRVQWLMIVEWVFDRSVIEMRGVFRHGVSGRSHF